MDTRGCPRSLFAAASARLFETGFNDQKTSSEISVD